MTNGVAAMSTFVAAAVDIGRRTHPKHAWSRRSHCQCETPLLLLLIIMPLILRRVVVVFVLMFFFFRFFFFFSRASTAIIEIDVFVTATGLRRSRADTMHYATAVHSHCRLTPFHKILFASYKTFLQPPTITGISPTSTPATNHNMSPSLTLTMLIRFELLHALLILVDCFP